jgi:hypothetical protein
MDDKSRALCDALARHIVDRNFGGAHALLAPWLRASMTPADIEQMCDEAGRGLPAPQEWTLDEGFLEVDDLRSPDPYGPPSKAVSDQVTKENYRGWMCIQLKPTESAVDDPNVCYDVWLAVVDQNGAHAVAYFEPAEAS